MRYDVPTLTDEGEAPLAVGPVTLRAHREDDVAGVVEQSLDPDSRLWTTVPLDYTRDHAKRFVREAMPGGWQLDVEWGFAVDVAGRFAGTVSLRNRDDGRAEIAYGSHPWVRGTGAMERALRLLLAWGFEERALHTVVWWANRGNWASRKLAWRLGFAVEGTVRGWLPHRGELLDGWVGTMLATDERRPRHRWVVPPVIESPRLQIRLRPAGAADLPRVGEGSRDEQTGFWLGGMPRPYPDELTPDWLLRCGEGMAVGSDLHLAAAARDDDRLLGVLALKIDSQHDAAEIGYWTHPAERGRGAMTEAVRLAARHALLPEDVGGLGLVRVFAWAALDNLPSRAVLTRAGLPEVSVDRLATRTSEGLRDAARHELLADELGAGTG
ncbi:MAG: GNAT family N-acetyltransferase [Marmoricola sp.]